MLAADRTETDFLASPSAIGVPELAAEDPSSIGPYRLLELLGEGGMGRVFLAEQEEPVKRRVALKILRFSASSDGARSIESAPSLPSPRASTSTGRLAPAPRR